MHTFFFIYGIISFIITITMLGMFFYLGWTDEQFDHEPFKIKKMLPLYLRRIIGLLLYVVFGCTMPIVLFIAVIFYLTMGIEIIRTYTINVTDAIENFVEGKTLKQ